MSQKVIITIGYPPMARQDVKLLPSAQKTGRVMGNRKQEELIAPRRARFSLGKLGKLIPSKVKKELAKAAEQFLIEAGKSASKEGEKLINKGTTALIEKGKEEFGKLAKEVFSGLKEWQTTDDKGLVQFDVSGEAPAPVENPLVDIVGEAIATAIQEIFSNTAKEVLTSATEEMVDTTSEEVDEEFLQAATQAYENAVKLAFNSEGEDAEIPVVEDEDDNAAIEAQEKALVISKAGSGRNVMSINGGGKSLNKSGFTGVGSITISLVLSF